MLHVGLDKVACGKSRAERELASQDGGGNYACQTAGILARVRRVGSTDAEHIEHSGLWLEDGATTQGTNFQRGHRDGDLKVSAETGRHVS